ncbi:hypothetical protein [Salinimicrobium marinum]|nr:hypothetical protein [Salinimicrobium marinum]
MSRQTNKNRRNLYLWIIVTILAVGLITGYQDGRADKTDRTESIMQP